MTRRFPFRGLDRLSSQSAEVSDFLSAPKLDPQQQAGSTCLQSWTKQKMASGHVAKQRPALALAARQIPQFSLAVARCHATRQHCSRDEAPRHPRRWLVPLLLRVGSSRRATSGTSTAFISSRADDSLVVAYLKGRWGCARIPITPPVCVVLL